MKEILAGSYGNYKALLKCDFSNPDSVLCFKAISQHSTDRRSSFSLAAVSYFKLKPKLNRPYMEY